MSAGSGKFVSDLREAELRGLDFLAAQLSDTANGWPAWAGGPPDPWTSGQILSLNLSKRPKHRQAAASAAQWLESQQNPYRGSWPGIDFHNEPHVQSTACAVIGLATQVGPSPLVEKAQDWLLQQYDGGWQSIPDAPGVNVNSLHRYATACAIRALMSGARRSALLDTAHRAVQVLKDQRAPASSAWGNYDDNPADSTFTCYVLHALLDVRDQTPAGIPADLIDRAIIWLSDQQNSDGTWGDWQGFNPSAEGTAYGSYILMRDTMSINDSARAALGRVLEMQATSGGWNLTGKSSSASGQNWVTYTALISIQLALTIIGDSEEPGGSQFYDIASMYETRTGCDLNRIPATRPMEHTMYRSLDEYVKRKVPEPRVGNAIKRGYEFEVHGIHPNDFRAVLHSQGYRTIRTVDFQPKASKRWNGERPAFFWADKPDGERILGCAVPPGEDYVLHYASMIRHVVAQLASTQSTVSAFRYRKAEREVFKYLGLNESVIGASDTVVVGYIDEVARRMPEVEWTTFSTESGHLGGFRGKSTSGKSLLLLGVSFSYWGSLAYQLASDIFDLNASELIYVGKLGTLTSNSDIYSRIFCPSQFVLASHTTTVRVARDVHNTLLANHSSLDSGTHASVPTVLEEDYHQRRALDSHKVSTIDNEIAQMAIAASQARSRGRTAQFGSCHFATDYIRAESEADMDTSFDLANHRSEVAQKAKSQILDRIVVEVIAPHLHG